MKTRIFLLIDSIIFLAFLIVFEPRITGTEIHEWLGMAFFFTLLTHLLLHWKWVVNVISKFFKKMTAKNRINFIVDFFVFLAFVLVTFSGLMISRFFLQTLGITIQTGGAWRQIHLLSAQVVLYLAALHFALHWKWVVETFKRFVIQPAARLFQPGTSLVLQPIKVEKNVEEK